LAILNYYRDDISLITGAHIHRNELRSSISDIYKNLQIPMLVTQSVTPVYLNNPAYTTLSINQSVQNQESGFLSLDQSLTP
jgi:hypothetical protein